MGKKMVSFLLPDPKIPAGKRLPWNLLFQSTKKEEVFPLFYRTILKNEVIKKDIPQNLLQKMGQYYYTQQGRQALFLEEFKRVVDYFQKSKISFLLFKGFDLAQRVYGDLSLRCQVDFDFIINPKDFSRAQEGLKELGYETDDPLETDFYKGKYRVELHRDIIHVKRFEQGPEIFLSIQGMWERQTKIFIEGTQIPVLNPEDLFLALSLHFAFHHHLRGLKWLTDLAWMVIGEKISIPIVLARAAENNLQPVLLCCWKRLKSDYSLPIPHELFISRKRRLWHSFFGALNFSLFRYGFRLGLLPRGRMRKKLIQDFSQAVKPKTRFLKDIHIALETRGTKVYEKILGIETYKSVSLPALGIEEAKGNMYAPAPYSELKKIFRHLEITPSDVFLDLGCGKGRVLLAASRYPFKKIRGMDIAPPLLEQAQRNIQKLGKRERCRDISLETADLQDYDIPQDVSVIYLYNSILWEGLEKVMANIQKSLQETPRPLTFIYNNPAYEKQLEQYPWIQKIYEYKLEYGDISYFCYSIYKMDLSHA